MKPKTLNDIPLQTDTYLELKTEAIKLAKQIKKGMIHNSDFKEGTGALYDKESAFILLNNKQLDKESCVEILKYFCNFTEEDLK